MGSGKRLRRNPQVDHRPDLLSFTVTGTSGPFPYQVDGDYLGMAEELTFSYEHHALAIVAPPPPSRGRLRRPGKTVSPLVAEGVPAYALPGAKTTSFVCLSTVAQFVN